MSFCPELTDRQTEAYLALNNPNIVDVMYGGAKGGGKSFFLCVWVFLWSLAIADRFGLIQTDNPIHIGWMGRKQATDFTATTLQTWQRVIPSSDFQIRASTERHPKHILIQNKIAVDYGGLDKQDSINKFNSAEYAFTAIDQTEETVRDDISVLRASRRLTIKGQQLKYKGLFTANPAICWLKDEFITEPVNHKYKFIQALPTDNPFLPDTYIETLKDSFGYRPELLEAYLHGKWDSIDGADQVIKSTWIDRARTAFVSQTETRILLSCDVARYGDDETVIYLMENTEIKDRWVYGNKGNDFIANELHIKSIENNRCPVAIDDCPIAAGVIDILKAMQTIVIPINSAAKPTVERNAEKYYNMRAQMWWEAGRKFANNEIQLKNIEPVLVRQLTGIKYKYRNSKILIESKEDIKQRMGESTDRADAYLIGLEALRYVEPTSVQQGFGIKTNSGVYIPTSLRSGVA